MYIKYREIGGDKLAILDVHSVRIVRDYDEGGFYLAPDWSMRESRALDAAISRLAALCCGYPTVQDRDADIRHNEADEFYPVTCQTYQPDPFDDCIAWYETYEEADTAVERIASAIARGEQIFDLTDEHFGAGL